SFEMMATGQAGSNAQPPLAVGDMDDLPVEEGALDAIVCRGALHHLPEPTRAVSEWYRTLQPGGWVVLSEPCNDGLFLSLARRLMVPRISHFGATHTAFTSGELSNLLTEAGFRVVATEKFGFVGFPLCALSDLLPLLHYLPGRDTLARALVRLDAWCASIPGVRRESWHCILAAQKPSDPTISDGPHDERGSP
ncbi:MAG: methyltransferase domain-containing protein, partial [Candidatus Binatia bacterium]